MEGPRVWSPPVRRIVVVNFNGTGPLSTYGVVWIRLGVSDLHQKAGWITKAPGAACLHIDAGECKDRVTNIAPFGVIRLLGDTQLCELVASRSHCDFTEALWALPRTWMCGILADCRQQRGHCRFRLEERRESERVVVPTIGVGSIQAAVPPFALKHWAMKLVGVTPTRVGNPTVQSRVACSIEWCRRILTEGSPARLWGWRRWWRCVKPQFPFRSVWNAVLHRTTQFVLLTPPCTLHVGLFNQLTRLCKGDEVWL